MKRYTYVLLCLMLGMTSSLFGQGVSTGYSNFMPPAPSAGASGASGGGLAHGMSGVSIPLANFATNQLSVPVSLSYYSTGTKVDQLASNVGLGWSLQAGGVITRTVRDHADEDDDPLAVYPSDFDELTGTALTFVVDAVDLAKTVDTEPDLFSFNFMGYSGSFIKDHSGNYHIMPYQDLKIETNNDLEFFKITTPDGMIYTFGDVNGGDLATESSRTWREGTFCQTATTAGDFVKSSWYLVKVEHPVNGELNFEYDLTANTYVYDAGISQTYYEEISSTSPYTCDTYDNEHCTIKIEIQERALTKISSPDFGSIEFTTSQRTGVGSLKLDNVVVKAADQTVLKQVELEYQTSLNDRMFLSNVTTKDKNGVQEGVYVFDYYDINKVPARLSYAQDHWGYYNGQDAASYFVADYVPEDNSGEPFSSYLVVPKYDPVADNIPGENSADLFADIGIDKSPDADYAKYGMLKSIVYPTTSVMTREYEGNTLKDDTEFGGLRLAKIKSYDPVTGQEYVTNYDYGPITDPTSSSGEASVIPSFWSYYSEFSNNVDLFDQPCAEFYDCTYAAMHSSPLNSLTNSSGQHITYEFVTVSQGDNFDAGATTYQFFISQDAEANNAHGEKINGVPLSNEGWDNGLVKEVQTYKKDDQGNFILLQKTVNHYTVDQSRTTETSAAVIRDTYDTGCAGNYVINCTEENNDPVYLVFCRASHTHNYTGTYGECIASGNDNDMKFLYNPPCYGKTPGETVVIYYEVENVDVMEYKLHSYWFYMDQTTSYAYDESGQNPVITNTWYKYEDPNHPYLTSTESDAHPEGLMKTEYVYPQDYASPSSVISTMLSKEIKAIPIETYSSVNGNVLSASATKFTYDATNDWVVPESFYAYEDTGGTYSGSTDGSTFSSYTKKGEILARDNKGQVISQKAENNIVSTVIRGYDQTLVVANITNATAAEVQTALPALGNDLSAGTGALSASDLTTLKTALPNALITSYTYKIGFGIETTTDPNGRITTYEYDDYGRVKYVRDHDGNIRSASEYHNKSQVSN